MNLDEIPDKFDSIEQANEFWHRLQQEKIQIQNIAIKRIQTNETKRLQQTESQKYYDQVYSTLLEDYS